MTYYDGGREPTGDAAATVEAMLDAAKRTFGPTLSRGTDGVITPFSTSTGIDRATYDQNWIRKSFVGRVVDKGPQRDPDLPGSRYWVREVWDYSNSNQENHRADWRLLAEFPTYGVVGGTAPRWVPATNLSEYNPEDENAEAHGLSTMGDVHVHVFMTLNRAGQSTWYFTSGGGIGSTLGFALVKDVYGGNAPIVQIQMLVIDPEVQLLVPQVNEETGQPEYADVWCWPYITSDHYEALVWPTQNPAPECNPIGIRQVGSRFYAEQTLLTFPIRSPGVAFSDCPLVF